ncbi:MAG: trypsin-like peptidase domain-containing protein [Planctomycetaceae bacterium]
MRSSVILLSTLLSWVTLSVSGTAQERPAAAGLLSLQQSLVRVAARFEPSVVAIARYRIAGNNTTPDGPNGRLFPDPDHPDFIPSEYGTGIVVGSPTSPDRRLILTCFHVVRGGLISRSSGTSARRPSRLSPPGGSAPPAVGERLHVRFSNRRGCPARILAADPRSDLAILELAPDDLKQAGLDPKTLTTVTLVARPQPAKGQFVLLLGNPFAIARDGSASVGWGLISNTGRAAIMTGDRGGPDHSIHRLGTLLQLDSRLKHGTSGGPVLDTNGQLIGLTTTIAPRDGVETAAGFAIPITAPMLRIIDTLRRGLEVEYGFLGIQPDDVSSGQLATYTGSFRQSSAARAARVFRGSPARRAGILTGDLILSAARRQVHSRYDLMRQIELTGPGREIALTLWRETTRERLQVRVRLGKWPVPDGTALVASRQRHAPWRGLEVDYPTGRRRFVPASFEFPQAVVITSVHPGSPAATAGIEAGDFIERVADQSTETPEEFFKAVDSRSGAVSLKLLDGRSIRLAP